MESAGGHVYVVWYKESQPSGVPARMHDEASATAEIIARYAAATFGRRMGTSGQPSAPFVGIEQVSYAYDGREERGKAPVAEILYPAPGSHLA